MKRRVVIVLLLVLALVIPASMLAQQSTKAEKEIRAVMEEFHQAILKGGAEAVATFAKYYEAGYVRVDSNGTVHTKAQALDGYRTGTTKVESNDISDLKIRTYGHTAVVTGVVKAQGTTLGVPNTPTGVRFTRIFVKRGGIWQCVLYQTTRIATPAKH